MSFKDLAMEERLGATSAAGEQAEQAFEAWQGTLGRQYNEHYWRLGFDRAGGGAAFASLDTMVRHIPDYCQVGGHLWEVQGTGRGVWLMKREKLEAVCKWQGMLSNDREVRWFLYDSADNTAIIAPNSTILAVLENERTVTYMDNLVDGKDGWLLPKEAFASRLVASDPFAATANQVKVQSCLNL